MPCKKCQQSKFFGSWSWWRLLNFLTDCTCQAQECGSRCSCIADCPCPCKAADKKNCKNGACVCDGKNCASDCCENKCCCKWINISIIEAIKQMIPRTCRQKRLFIQQSASVSKLRRIQLFSQTSESLLWNFLNWLRAMATQQSYRLVVLPLRIVSVNDLVLDAVCNSRNVPVLLATTKMFCHQNVRAFASKLTECKCELRPLMSEPEKRCDEEPRPLRMI